MDTYVAKVQVGNNANDLSPIGSTMFGVCNSSATATTKVVTFNKFDKLINGITVMVKFTNGNSLPGNLKLQVGSTLAYDITGDCICGENEVIAFTFEEVDGTHKYWRANSSGITAAMKEFIINTINTSTDTPDVLIIKGSIGAGGNPGYLPAAGYETGWIYRVVTAGTYIGQKCEVGDLIIAIQDASPSQGSINNAHWIVAQGKIQNVVTNPSPATINHVPVFVDGTGQVIGDGGFTLGKSVPADAQFTDTTYTNGTGLELEDTTFSVKFGTTAGTVAEGNDARFAALAPITHTHGNISNDGMLGTGNNLLRTSSGEIVAGPVIGNDTTKYLSNAATWVDIPVTSVNGQTGDVVVELSSLNIDAMRFIGQATVNITPDSNTNPVIQGYTWPDDRVAGDVILGYTDGREYILDSTFHWILLGQDASTTFDSDSLSADANRDSNVWVAHIQQASDRTITATMGALDTSGTWTGNATTATAWENARKVYVNLENASQNTTINGDVANAEAIGIGIDGVLDIGHGGTGTNTFEDNTVIISKTVSGILQLDSRKYIDNTTATPISTHNYFITERSIYYGLPTINDIHNYNSSYTLFIPTTHGSDGQILIANTQNSNEPIWARTAIITEGISTIISEDAYSILTLGNNIASTSSTAHSEGQILLYSSGTYGHIIAGMGTIIKNYTHTFQNEDGYILQSETAGAVGSNTQPIYINSDGRAQALTYTANRLYYSSNTTNFIAGNYYANGSKLGINITSWPVDSNSNAIPGVLYVDGGTTITGTTQLADNVGIGIAPQSGTGAHLLFVNGSTGINGTVDISGVTFITSNVAATDNTGALKVTGGILTSSNLYVTSTSELLSYVSIGEDRDTTNTNYILTITGSTMIKNTGAVGYLEIDVTNNVESLIFKPHVSGRGQIGLNDARWQAAFFSENVNLTNSGSSIDLAVFDGTNNIGTITIITDIPTIDLTDGNDTWSILFDTTDSNEKIFSITNNAQNNTVHLDGYDNGFTIAPRLYINTTIANSPVNLHVEGDSYLNGSVGIGMEPETGNNITHILSVQGSIVIMEDSNTTLAHFYVPTQSEPFNFSPDDTYDGSIGLIDHKWDTGYFYSSLEVSPRNSTNTALQGITLENTGILTIQNATANIILDTTLNNNAKRSELSITSNGSIIDLYTSGESGAEIGQITITTEIPTILLNTTSGADWIITNNIGEFSLNNQIGNTPVELRGNNNGFEIYPRLYINEAISDSDTLYTLSIGGNTYSDGNIIPGSNKNLGSTDDMWAKIYVGTAPTYGDAYLPIYWNDGVPTYLDGIVQYKEFTFTSGQTSITLSSTAYNQHYNIHTYIIQIVVTGGENYLQAPISWTTGQVSGSTTTGTVVLSTITAVTGTVSGYILTVRGCTAP